MLAAFTVTSEDPSGPGSLRQAVIDANSNGNPAEVDTITFASNVDKIIQGDLLDPTSGAADEFVKGPIVITQSVNIAGPGSDDLTIDGSQTWVNAQGPSQ